MSCGVMMSCPALDRCRLSLCVCVWLSLKVYRRVLVATSSRGSNVPKCTVEKFHRHNTTRITHPVYSVRATTMPNGHWRRPAWLVDQEFWPFAFIICHWLFFMKMYCRYYYDRLTGLYCTLNLIEVSYFEFDLVTRYSGGIRHTRLRTLPSIVLGWTLRNSTSSRISG